MLNAQQLCTGTHGARPNGPSWQTNAECPVQVLHRHTWTWNTAQRPIMADYPSTAPQSHSSCLGTVPSPPPPHPHQTMDRWCWYSRSALLPRPRASRVPRPVENSEGMRTLRTHQKFFVITMIFGGVLMEDSVFLKATILVSVFFFCVYLVLVRSYILLIGIMV